MILLDEIAYPRGWDEPRKQLRFLTTGTVLIALLMLPAAAILGSLVSLIYGLGALGASAYLFSLLSWHYLSGRWARVEHLEDGGEMLMARELCYLKWTWIAGAVLGIPVFAMVVVQGREVYSDRFVEGTLGYWMGQLVLVASPVALVALPLILVALVVGRVMTKGDPKGVGISVNGIYHWWWAGCSFFPWQEISDVTLMRPMAGPMVKLAVERCDYQGYAGESKIGRAPVIRRWSRKLNLGQLRTHPGLVYQALFFYLRNPELREELEDERSVVRMREGDYGDIPGEIRSYGRALAPSEVSAA